MADLDIAASWVSAINNKSESLPLAKMDVLTESDFNCIDAFTPTIGWKLPDNKMILYDGEGSGKVIIIDSRNNVTDAAVFSQVKSVTPTPTSQTPSLEGGRRRSAKPQLAKPKSAKPKSAPNSKSKSAK